MYLLTLIKSEQSSESLEKNSSKLGTHNAAKLLADCVNFFEKVGEERKYDLKNLQRWMNSVEKVICGQQRSEAKKCEI
jgi:hypothetical protein